MLLIAILIFFVVSAVLSIIGLGGGAFYVPVLLAIGYSFPEASSTSLFLIMVTGISAFTQFQKAKLVDWQLAVVMDTFTDIGAFVGGYTAFHFQDRYLKILFGILLILAAYFILRMQGKQKIQPEPRKGFGYWQREFGEHRYSIFVPAIIPITFVIGYLSGALGVAGALLKIPIMVLWFNVPAKIAVATSSLMVGLTGLLGFGGHLFTGIIDWPLVLGVGIVVFAGGQIGSRISIKLPEKKIKKVIAAVFLLLALWMIARALVL